MEKFNKGAWVWLVLECSEQYAIVEFSFGRHQLFDRGSFVGVPMQPTHQSGSRRMEPESIEMERQRYRITKHASQTDRKKQTDGQTDRQTGRQADRQTD